MTDDERNLLRLCNPEVTLQLLVPFMEDQPLDKSKNRHLDVAEDCVGKGWLEFVRDRKPNQSVYRITPAGYDVLKKSTPST